MKIAIMQPYFIPYIGYWQLINAVDKFVIYDDVNYKKKGWINRNRILTDGRARYFNIPIIDASQNRKINEMELALDSEQAKKRLKTLEYTYKKAPYYQMVYPMFERIITCKEKNLSLFIENSLFIISDYLNIMTEFITSSSIDKDCSLKGQEKILAICKQLGAAEYYNASGGQELYSFNEFKRHGIQLKFIETQDIIYKQFKNKFQTNLSILDVMMFNSKEQVKEMLEAYNLITQGRIQGK